LLLAKNREGCTAWHEATVLRSLEALEILWNWAKEMGLNTDELFLAQSGRGYTTLHKAALGKPYTNIRETAGLG
jgi:hypothetical protein